MKFFSSIFVLLALSTSLLGQNLGQLTLINNLDGAYLWWEDNGHNVVSVAHGPGLSLTKGSQAINIPSKASFFRIDPKFGDRTLFSSAANKIVPGKTYIIEDRSKCIQLPPTSLCMINVH